VQILLLLLLLLLLLKGTCMLYPNAPEAPPL
jgi:hypothetical protein